MELHIFPSKTEMARAAAASAAAILQAALTDRGSATFVAATGNSQLEFLAALAAEPGVDWSRTTMFHLDEYIGLPPTHPASFRRYLQEHLIDRVRPGLVHLIQGDSPDPRAECARLNRLIGSTPIDVAFVGIGENGHLAFNDPPVADFLDPVRVKVVRLDAACRTQQLNDGCFERIEDVPTHAYTLTVPALLSASTVSVVVPGPRKADAVLATLRGPFGEACPATALRHHSGATLYLDRESARHVL